MQSSFSIQIGVLLALLSTSSQALPILDRASSLVPRSPDSIFYPPPSHRHGERNHDGDEDVISLYGLYRRHLTSANAESNEHDLESRNVPHHQSFLHDPNASSFTFQTTDSTATFTTTTTVIATTVATATQGPFQDKFPSPKSTTHDSHLYPVAFTLSPPNSTPPQSPGTLPERLATVHNLYASQWHQHKPDVSKGKSKEHEGSVGEPIFRANALLHSHHGQHGWKSLGAFKRLFARPGYVINKIMPFTNSPLHFPHFGITLPVVRVHQVPPAKVVSEMSQHPTNPSRLISKLLTILNAPFRMPGVGPAGRIYLSLRPSFSQMQREKNPLYQNHHRPSPLHNAGTIHMASPTLTHSQTIPIHFTLSPQTCHPLATECLCIVEDLATRLLESYPDGIPASTNSVTETVVLNTQNKSGLSYRATLDLVLDDKIDGKGFKDLLGLLVSVKKELVRVAAGARGFGTVDVNGEWMGVGVRALWTYYQVGQDGVARQCI